MNPIYDFLIYVGGAAAFGLLGLAIYFGTIVLVLNLYGRT